MLPLYPHQSDAINRALVSGGSLALFHEPGLGKTRTALEIFARLRTTTPDLKMLVVCPLTVMDAVWGAEITHATTFRWCALKRCDRAADIYVINYESITRASGQRALQASGLFSGPLLLVADESSCLKDPRAITTKVVLALAQSCQARLVMSGTPAPNGLQELWAQIKVVAPDVLPRSFYTFRREFFYLGRAGQTRPDIPVTREELAEVFRKGWEVKITPANQERLLARIAPVCSWVRKRDALQLPDRITTIRHVTLSPAEHRAYEQMRRQLVVEFQTEVVTAEIALTKLMKLRQLSSGFCYGETAHRTGTSRLTVLLETLEELGNQPVIIWCQFIEELAQVMAALGEQAVGLYGHTDNRAESLRRFGTEAQYLVAHPRSAGHGLTLTQSSTCVWYSLDWSLEAYVQANDRIHRIGQSRSCLYYHLISPGRIDEYIWQVLQRKATLQEAIDRTLGGRVAPPDRPRHHAPVADGVGVSSIGEVACGSAGFTALRRGAVPGH